MRIPVLAAALLLCTSAAFAQAPAPEAKPKARPAYDCSKAKDPARCEEMRTKVKAAHEKAAKACEGKPQAERRDCMRTEMCKESKDPAKCEARAKAARERHAKAMEACKGKEGEELKSCLRAQRPQRGGEKK